MIKYFRFSYDYVLWDISYANLNMLQATIPSYKSDQKGKQKKRGNDSEGEENGEVEDLTDIAEFLNIKPKNGS